MGASRTGQLQGGSWSSPNAKVGDGCGPRRDGMEVEVEDKVLVRADAIRQRSCCPASHVEVGCVRWEIGDAGRQRLVHQRATAFHPSAMTSHIPMAGSAVDTKSSAPPTQKATTPKPTSPASTTGMLNPEYRRS